MDDLPPIDALIPEGELPSPEDEPPPAKELPERDPAASTTSQVDPIDQQERSPEQGIVLGLDDELPPLDEIEIELDEMDLVAGEGADE